MSIREKFNNPPNPITYEALPKKSKLKAIDDQQLREAKQFRENLRINTHMSWVIYLVTTVGLSYFCTLNNDFVNKGYEVRNYKDSELTIHSACPKYGEMVNINTNQCETPAIKNLANSMLYLNAYLMVLTVALNIIVSEPVYGLYGEKSAKFRIKGLGSNDKSLTATGPQDSLVLQSPELSFEPSTMLESLKSFVTNPDYIAKLKIAVRNTSISTGVCVIGLGGYSYSLYQKYEEDSGHFGTGKNPNDICQTGDLTKYYKCGLPKFKNTAAENTNKPILAMVTMTVKGQRVRQQMLIRPTEYKNRYALEDKTEVYVNKKGNEYNVTNIIPKLKTNFSIKLNKTTGAKIIACPDSNVEQSIILNQKHGYETIAIVGTGTIGNTNPTKKKQYLENLQTNPNYKDAWITEYKVDKLTPLLHMDNKTQYVSPAGEVFVRFPDDNKTLFTNLQQSNGANGKTSSMNPEIRNAGFVTYKDGRTKLLDFLGKDSTKKVGGKIVSTTDPEDKKYMNSELNKLRMNSSVESFSITGWAARQKNGVATNEGAQSRLVYAFDKTTKELLGVLLTANITFGEVNENVKKAFGPNAESVVMDGDFYAGFLDLRKMRKEMVGANIPTRNTNLYFTNSAMCMVVAKEKPELNIMSPELKKVAMIRAQDEFVKDKITDPWKQFFGWWNQLTGQK